MRTEAWGLASVKWGHLWDSLVPREAACEAQEPRSRTQGTWVRPAVLSLSFLSEITYLKSPGKLLPTERAPVNKGGSRALGASRGSRSDAGCELAFQSGGEGVHDWDSHSLGIKPECGGSSALFIPLSTRTFRNVLWQWIWDRLYLKIHQEESSDNGKQK